MVQSSSTTRHAGWLRSVLTLWPDGLNASGPSLSPRTGWPLRFVATIVLMFIRSFSDAIGSMVIAKQAVASITMGDPTTDISMRSLVSRDKVTIQQEHLYLRIVMPARPDAASPCRQLALKARRMRRSGFRVHVGLLSRKR